MKPSAMLAAAKEKLTPDTWAQGNIVGGALPANKLCAMIALDMVDPADPATIEAAATYMFQVVGKDVMRWQDTPGRTLPEVYEMFDKAIMLAQAAGA